MGKLVQSDRYSCEVCGYKTDDYYKIKNHQNTIKHKIASRGIRCCGLIYYEKHKYVNHKKSRKHVENGNPEGELLPPNFFKIREVDFDAAKETLNQITDENEKNFLETLSPSARLFLGPSFDLPKKSLKLKRKTN